MAKLAVCVLIDALGWSYLRGRQFLDDELKYRVPLRTVLGFSSAAIPTILTGVAPSQHGHWNLFYRDEAHSPFRWLRHFGFLPDAVLNHRVTTKVVKELGRRVLGLGSMFECYVAPRFLPQFNFVEKRNIYERRGITGAASIFDELGEAGIPYRAYSYHHLTDEQILERSMIDLQDGGYQFLFLYLSEMDAFLHHHCSEPEQVEQRLAWYESRLRKVFALALEHDREATLTVISDHGMTPVGRHFDLAACVDSLGLRMPPDYLVVYDSTMARFWFKNAGARERIVAMLGEVPCGRILRDDELERLGILFPDRRYGELIFLLEPGCLIAKSNFNGRGWMPLGMHGYHPDDAYSSGIFLSNRVPGVAPHSIADVHRLMWEAIA